MNNLNDYAVLVGFSLTALILLYFLSNYFRYRVEKAASRNKSKFIQEYQFPKKIRAKLYAKYPHLKSDDADMVFRGLREYFHICKLGNNSAVAMPSQAVDLCWHEFILHTKEYARFCQKGFKRFLHHTPTESKLLNSSDNGPLKRTWRLSCILANISLRNPKRLPILFAIDKTLRIPNGFYYALDCRTDRTHSYCITDLNSTGTGSDCTALFDSGHGHSGDIHGDTDHFDAADVSASSDSGCSSGDSGGCGSGCGGGD